ncbi:MAG: TIGR03667 family PPOX class F420-dependent oxidoreductase [Mycobacterium sp.]
MTAELTQEVSSRLTDSQYGWLTTVAKSGQPVPKLIWFYFDGTDIVIYTMPTAAKVGHIERHPQVSVNLDSDGNGGGIVVIGGVATIDATGVDPREDGPYWAKFGALSDQFGLTETMGSYDTRIKISVDKVWVTPS